MAGRAPQPLLGATLLVLALGALAQGIPWAVYAASAWTRIPWPATLPVAEVGGVLHKVALVGLVLFALLGDASAAAMRARAAGAFVLLVAAQSLPDPLFLPEAGPVPRAEKAAGAALEAAAWVALLWPSWRAGALGALGPVLPLAGQSVLAVAWDVYGRSRPPVAEYPYDLVGAGFALHALGFFLLQGVFLWAAWRAAAPPKAEPAEAPAGAGA